MVAAVAVVNVLMRHEAEVVKTEEEAGRVAEMMNPLSSPFSVDLDQRSP